MNNLKNIFYLCVFVLLFTKIYANTIAVSYFENNSLDPKYNSLSKGIANMLITDLLKIDGVAIVERVKLENILNELKLGQTGLIDLSTAKKVGNFLQADAILTGAFVIFKDEIRIDARLVDVKTSNIIISETVIGNIENFLDAYSNLVFLLTKNFSITKTKIESKKQSVPLSTILDYSNAIDNIENGFEKEGLYTLSNIVDSNPYFSFAKIKLKEIRNIQKEIEGKHKKILDIELNKILKNIDFTSNNWKAKLNNNWNILISSSSYSKLLLFNSHLIKNKINEKAFLYFDSTGITVGEMLEMYNLIAYTYLKKHKEVIINGQMFLKKFPLSIYYIGMENNINMSIAELEQQEIGTNKIDSLLKRSKFITTLYFLDNIGNRIDTKESIRFFEYTLDTYILPYLNSYSTFSKNREDFTFKRLKSFFNTAKKLKKQDLAKKLSKLSLRLSKSTSDTAKANKLINSYKKFQKRLAKNHSKNSIFNNNLKNILGSKTFLLEESLNQKILIEYTKICKKNKQYIKEITYLKEILNNNVESSILKHNFQYSVFTAYINLGYFELARDYATLIVKNEEEDQIIKALKMHLKYSPK